MRLFTSIILTLVVIAKVVWAHPGELEEYRSKQNLGKRDIRVHSARGLDRCSAKLAERDLWKRALERRARVVQKPELNPDIVNDTNHHSQGNFSVDTSEEIIFAGTTCGLSPEGETGPQYIPGGLIRTNISDH